MYYTSQIFLKKISYKYLQLSKTIFNYKIKKIKNYKDMDLLFFNSNIDNVNYKLFFINVLQTYIT